MTDDGQAGERAGGRAAWVASRRGISLNAGFPHVFSSVCQTSTGNRWIFALIKG